MEEADKLCDRIAIMDDGKIIALDTPLNLKKSLGGDIILLKGHNINIEGLKNLPYVKCAENQGAFVQLAVEDSGRRLQEILRVAGEIESVEAHLPDLNDVFLHYTGKEIREEEGTSLDRIRAIRRANNK